jgi:glycerophosphoryl diester phosphodiesterase
MRQSVPVIVAHRGASKTAPENTLPAFELAWQQGADAIEGDFRMTADKQIVCFHDPFIQTSSAGRIAIEELTFPKLQEMAAALPDHKETIPTLDEVLGIVPPQKGIFIEIKCGTEIVPILLSLIQQSGIAPHQVTFISFNNEVIRMLKNLSPGITANWLTRFRRDRLRLVPDANAIIGMLEKIGADGVGVQASRRLDKTFATTIKHAGFGLHAWTVDSCQMAKKFVQIGFDSITTNQPGKIRSCLFSTQSH